jgi:hypothetical protein
MMSKMFAVKVDPDSDIQILFAAPSEGGAGAYGVVEDIIEKSGSTLSGALDMVRSIAVCASNKLKDLDVAGAEATVGLKLSGKGQFIVAEASAEATLTVKITLKK